MKQIYEYVETSYNTGDGFWTVDAWKPGNEEGEVIAVINDVTGGVFRIGDVDDYAQSVIKEKVDEIARGKITVAKSYELEERIENLQETFNAFRKEEEQALKNVLADCCGGDFEFDEDSEPYCIGHTHEFKFPVEFRVEKVAIEDEEIKIYASPILGGEPYEQMKMPAYKFMPGQIMKITERIFYGWLDIQEKP